MPTDSGFCDLPFQREDREGLLAGLGVSYAELSTSVFAPAPGQALVIDCNAKVFAEAHFYHSIRYRQHLVRKRDISSDAAAPEE